MYNPKNDVDNFSGMVFERRMEPLQVDADCYICPHCNNKEHECDGEECLRCPYCDQEECKNEECQICKYCDQKYCNDPECNYEEQVDLQLEYEDYYADCAYEEMKLGDY